MTRPTSWAATTFSIRPVLVEDHHLGRPAVREMRGGPRPDPLGLVRPVDPLPRRRTRCRRPAPGARPGPRCDLPLIPRSAFNFAAASITARPPSTVEREAVVWPAVQLVGSCRRPRGARSWAAPAPRWPSAAARCAPLAHLGPRCISVTVPSASGRRMARPNSLSPLPMPVFFAAACDAHRPAGGLGLVDRVLDCQQGLLDARRPGPRIWPVPNRYADLDGVAPAHLPAVDPDLLGQDVEHPSMAKFVWFAPNPAHRAARRVVRVDAARPRRPRCRTAYTPQACPAARSSTLSPTLA